MTGREHVALGPPPSDPAALHGFPRWTLTSARTLFRAHSTSNGPWSFASAPGGRWDLPTPHGTVYLADSAEAALRESIGRVLSNRATLTETEVDASRFSRLHMPGNVRLADLCSRNAASYGLTREIHTLTPYALTQVWAVAFRTAGAGGVRYDARFSTGRARAYSVFGDAGPRSWPDDPTRPRRRRRCGHPRALDPALGAHHDASRHVLTRAPWSSPASLD